MTNYSAYLNQMLFFCRAIAKSKKIQYNFQNFHNHLKTGNHFYVILISRNLNNILRLPLGEAVSDS